VKPYHRNSNDTSADNQKPPVHNTPEPPRRRERPEESKNKPKPAQAEPSRRNPKKKIKHYDAHVSKKKAADLALALQLRREGKIITSGKPFEQSDYTEINALISSGVLRFKNYNPKIYGNTRIFDSRIVREIKGKGTP
jgi:hypothetical protein